MTAITGIPEGATDAILRFDVIDARADERGISKSALAELVDIDPSTMWRYRRGMKPNIAIVLRIGEALGLTVGEMTAHGTPTPASPSGPTSPPPPPGPKVGKS